VGDDTNSPPAPHPLRPAVLVHGRVGSRALLTEPVNANASAQTTEVSAVQDANLNDERTDSEEQAEARAGRMARLLQYGRRAPRAARYKARHAAQRVGRHAARRARAAARRGRSLGLGAAALTVASLAAVGGSAPGGLLPQPTNTSTMAQGVLNRSTEERADRSTRTAPSTSPSPTEPAPTPSATPSSAPPPAPPKPKPAWVSPMPGATVTSCFGLRWGIHHAGIDLALPPGTPVLAVGAGTVEAAGWIYAGYGISVVINHGNGYLTHYAHLSKATVSPGQKVSAGQQIGTEGSTGDSTGPHLHFEVHKGMWNQIEPAKWLRDRGVHIPGC